MIRYYHHVSHDDLLRVTRALLKFRRDHGYAEGGLEELAARVRALEADDFANALGHFRAIPFGGMGCFNDWFPPAVYDHEDPEYAWVAFDALTERTLRLMHLAAGDKWPLKKSIWRMTG